MKKALMNASVASMIYKFNMDNIMMLEKMGYQVDVACNFGKENPISEDEIMDFRTILHEKNIRVCETTCPRSIFAINKMIEAYKQLKKLADSENYDMVHTQSPIGGVVCRLAFRKARKKGTKVIYQAHGFHFYKGAPFMNWIVFYPIEKICSYLTDVMITINKEDYILAQKRMKAKRIVYVPGVGLDLSKFTVQEKCDREKYRNKLGIKTEDRILLSIGELNENKNHTVVIRALAEIQDRNIHYVIAGKGKLEKELRQLSASLGVADRVHFLGFCTDVKMWYEAADVFVFPSKREGLSVSLMEAMASGLPCAVSRIRGNMDLIDEEGGVLFDPKSVRECSEAIKKIFLSDLKQMKNHNCLKIQSFSKESIYDYMEQVYQFVLG